MLISTNLKSTPNSDLLSYKGSDSKSAPRFSNNDSKCLNVDIVEKAKTNCEVPLVGFGSSSKTTEPPKPLDRFITNKDVVKFSAMSDNTTIKCASHLQQQTIDTKTNNFLSLQKEQAPEVVYFNDIKENAERVDISDIEPTLDLDLNARTKIDSFLLHKNSLYDALLVNDLNYQAANTFKQSQNDHTVYFNEYQHTIVAENHSRKKLFEQASSSTSFVLTHTKYRLNQCEIYNKSFSCKSQLKQHLECHSKLSPFQCTICNKNFKRKWLLIQHFECHSELRPFQCTTCDKTFKNKWQLKRHFECHSKLRPFQCTICNKTFKRKWLLKQHFECHSELRPFQCTICDKTFKNKWQLKRHFVCHSELMPFQCTNCNKSFKSNWKLKRHFECHTELRPFQCTICNKSFKRKCHLKQHFEYHSELRPFRCTICNKFFKRISHLTKHYKTHSKEK